jgi:hypothetical protein
MDKAEIVAAVQKEFAKHNFDTFVDEPPSGPGRKRSSRSRLLLLPERIQTVGQIIDQVSKDVLPGIVETAVRSGSA